MVVTKQNNKLSEIKSCFNFVFDRDPGFSGDYLCLLRRGDYLYLDSVYCDVDPERALWALTDWGREVIAWCAPFAFLADVKREIPRDFDE